MERAAGQRCPAALFRWLTEETWKLLAISNAVTPPGDGGGRGGSIDTKTHHGVRPSVDATAPRPGSTDSKAALDVRSSTVMAMNL